MKNKKGYRSTPLSSNRRMIRASASVTRGKNSIHFMSEVDISRPRHLINDYFEQTGERLSFTAYIVTCLALIHILRLLILKNGLSQAITYNSLKSTTI